VLGDAVGGDEFLCVLAQYFPDLVGRPDKELAFLALAVGVLGRIESPFRIKHFAHHIVQNLHCDGAEELIASYLPSMEGDTGQLRIVIKHSLKVGYAMCKPNVKG
jgi:hypothetical protein